MNQANDKMKAVIASHTRMVEIFHSVEGQAQLANVLVSHIDRLNDPCPVSDPLEKIVSDLLEAYDAVMQSDKQERNQLHSFPPVKELKAHGEK